MVLLFKYSRLSSIQLILIITLQLSRTLIAQVKSSSQYLTKDEQNPCTSKETCRDCITADASCAWCLQDGYSDETNKPRCDFYPALINQGCHSSQIYFPTSFVNVTDTREFTDQQTDEDSAVQLKPKRITLKLRPKDTKRIDLHFKQAIDYPVDLYYLMDLSKSMEDDKEKLGLLGNKLAQEMQRITKNFRLGFGSFVDKTVMPYINTVESKRREPCDGCVAPYGFRNHMPLNTDSEIFTSRVKATNISGNLDAPEGGFDAIMQAVVCTNEIGWRRDSRKLVVFSTDSGFHYAGDGKLGGIIKPNDGDCHMYNGEYTESTAQDYPSISQINQKVMDNSVNLIFAVTANQFEIYDKLKQLIKGSSTGILKNDSSNIVDLVKAEYAKITSSVELLDDYKDDDIKIEYYSTCLNGKLEKRNKCDGLKVGTQVDFEVRLTVLKCPESRYNWNQTINISPVGLKESLTLDLQILCECECERTGMGEKYSDKCNGGGTYECGICNCYDNRYGRNCECDAKDIDSIKDESHCRYQNESRLCSGRGNCVCGACQCLTKSPLERIFGPFCECDNFSCLRADGKICSGHGECVCRICKCDEGWIGPDCSCYNSTEQCRAPGEKSDKLCGGNGVCKCNQCVCGTTEDNQPYTGQYCELCPTCKSQCEKLKDCVRCKAYQTGPLKDTCYTGGPDSKCDFNPILVDDFQVDKEAGEVLCLFVDEDDGCRFRFKYKIEENKAITVTAEKTKDCPKPVNILAIVIGVIVGIVLVGLALLLIWKLLTTIHDRREYAKFEKERQMARWDTGENPIFKHATTTFKNPIYGGKSGSAIKNSSHTALLNSGHSNSSHGMLMNSGHGTVVKGHGTVVKGH